MSAGATLKKKVGPLPVWAWGAAIGLGILIYYVRSNSGGASVGGAAATATPTLDPTQGSFPMPNGISAGGTGIDNPTPLTAGDIADAVSAQLVPVISTLPQASVPGEPSDGGASGPGDIIGTITWLRENGFISGPQPASTGAATSKPQTHTKPAHVSERVNRQPNSPRKGEKYRRVEIKKPTKTHKAGIYHVYGSGKTARWVRVKK